MQTGGSQRLWLERWGPESVLLLAVDGNSGSVTQAVFRTVQDTHVYLILLESLTRQRGIPQPFTRPARSLQKQRRSKASACGMHPVRQGDAGTGHPIQQILTLSLLAKDGWNGWRKHSGPAGNRAAPSCAWWASVPSATPMRSCGNSCPVKHPVKHPVRRRGGEPRDCLSPSARRTVSDRDRLQQTHPQGGLGQHGEVSLGVLQLLPGAGRSSYAGPRVRCPGTGRQRSDDQVPRRDHRISGGTTALVGAVGGSRAEGAPARLLQNIAGLMAFVGAI